MCLHRLQECIAELDEHHQQKQAEDRRPKTQPKVEKQSKQDSVKEVPKKISHFLHFNVTSEST